MSNNKIQTWEIETGNLTFDIHYEGEASIVGLDISPNGKLIAFVGNYDIRVWDTTTQNYVLEATAESLINNVVFVTNERLVSITCDSDIETWDIGDDECVSYQIGKTDLHVMAENLPYQALGKMHTVIKRISSGGGITFFPTSLINAALHSDNFLTGFSEKYVYLFKLCISQSNLDLQTTEYAKIKFRQFEQKMIAEEPLIRKFEKKIIKNIEERYFEFGEPEKEEDDDITVEEKQVLAKLLDRLMDKENLDCCLTEFEELYDFDSEYNFVFYYYGFTPLSLASRLGLTNYVHRLLEAGANPNFCSSSEDSPLRCSNNAETFQILVEAGAETSLPSEDSCHDDITDFILHESNCNLVEKRKILKFLESREVDIFREDLSWSRLYGEAFRVNFDGVQVMLDLEADLHCTCNDGRTALHAVAWQSQSVNISRKDTINIIQTLVKNGLPVDEQDDEGRSALHIAAKGDGSSPISVETLIECGAQVNLQDNRGATPLIQATRDGCPKSIQILLNNGADANITDEDGWKAVDYAIENLESWEEICRDDVFFDPLFEETPDEEQSHKVEALQSAKLCAFLLWKVTEQSNYEEEECNKEDEYDEEKYSEYDDDEHEDDEDDEEEYEDDELGSRQIDWINISNLTCRFDLDRKYRVEEKLGCIFITKEEKLLSKPDIFIVAISTNKTLEEMRIEEENNSRQAEIVKINDNECLLTKGYDNSHGFVTAYAIIFEKITFICSFKCDKQEECSEELESLARKVVETLEVKDLKYTEDVDRIEVPSSGFSISLPSGWEKMEMMGEITVYAPEGDYQPRISFSGDDEEEEDWESPQEPLEEFILGNNLLAIYQNFEPSSIEEIKTDKYSGFQLSWTGEVKRTDGSMVEAKGLGIAIPNKKRGAFITYLATKESFPKHKQKFLAMIDSILWLEQ